MPACAWLLDASLSRSTWLYRWYFTVGEQELALKLKTSLFTMFVQIGDVLGMLRFRAWEKEPSKHRSISQDLVETTSVSRDRGLISYFKIGN